MRTRAEGFALLAVLALLAVVGLYTAATLQDVLFGSVLAGTRVSQQRAFVLAELGVQNAEQELSGTTPPADFTRELHPLAEPQTSVTVAVRSDGDEAVPVGYSSGRFLARRFEIESTGHAARGARFAQVQGVVRMVPLAAAEQP
jgi:Tfp pilus assembly protein PilX